MNGQEKSDPAIVAERPTNEAGRPAEEPAEPRAGAEGNANQQSAFRTPRRVDASQAPERIRPAARLRRPSPEVGAVCGNPARTVLCGGRSAMSVPTAIFVPPDLEFVPSGLDFIPKNLDFLHPLAASAFESWLRQRGGNPPRRDRAANSWPIAPPPCRARAHFPAPPYALKASLPGFPSGLSSGERRRVTPFRRRR